MASERSLGKTGSGEKGAFTPNIVMLSSYAKCLCAECRYTDRHGAQNWFQNLEQINFGRDGNVLDRFKNGFLNFLLGHVL